MRGLLVLLLFNVVGTEKGLLSFFILWLVKVLKKKKATTNQQNN